MKAKTDVAFRSHGSDWLFGTSAAGTRADALASLKHGRPFSELRRVERPTRRLAGVRLAGTVKSSPQPGEESGWEEK